MTILEALNWGQKQLRETAAEKRIMQANPMLDAQLLLAACLQKPTSFLFANGEEELLVNQINDYQRMIERRKRHEPIAHIQQYKEFFGRDFYVNRFVLTPRPETESIIEQALELITPNSTIIDVGTGSGAIAVTLAIHTQQPVIAIDIDLQALCIAKTNAQAHGVDHLLSFLHGSILDPYLQKNIHESGHGIIIANLPYLTPLQWELADPDVKEYEPKHALVGGIDGLELYDKLLQQIQNNRNHLPTNLDILLEIDPGQNKTIHSLIKEHFPQASIEILNDINRQPRIVKIKI
ncbi:MAG: hypothetical protein ACD_66C00152G0003 [uncultured bacterium]|uniref:Release factor glutamine methyltransferase n=1 Tax=Candidatus Uhrbacteria bacterium GW2011_GWC1_41_20 TaxID=1618983 RepID=A0A0G0VJJ0_9BACT|nr:MAG: hypothetical protein ACD_66C00152G0003 [uncultured bacterium]KKR23098.1 MAG: Release factor glutamine methyltransferase [Candidatus Uhrbacteria bacterium GW2011_GWE1_39_46]KKR64337.1 MAG: Release factor glutamine methyltransferase [Candidatus Uhrbacteria bacterium GW2011_GWC2_40_450]KKR90507.1 MAG: Release factor glutamine methyltransferase [Candidatus Uhrbacteria bacterium GW2011_GWD2_41_121]KKR94075.1 MAG: Release factor glutamine methyltransferase [Candidatus Uhrbacteria bacterium GW